MPRERRLQYSNEEIRKTGKMICNRCEGTGIVYEDVYDDWEGGETVIKSTKYPGGIECSSCEGTGELLIATKAEVESGKAENAQGWWVIKRKDRKGCFISTACVNTYSLPDDCQELRILRRFRDQYIRYLPDGEKIIDEYYAIAPIMVEKIAATPDSQKVWETIFATIQQAVFLISEQRYDEAFREYVRMVNSLKEQYLPLFQE